MKTVSFKSPSILNILLVVITVIVTTLIIAFYRDVDLETGRSEMPFNRTVDLAKSNFSMNREFNRTVLCTRTKPNGPREFSKDFILLRRE